MKYKPHVEGGALKTACVIDTETNEVVWEHMGYFMSYDNAWAAAESKACRLMAQEELEATGEHAAASLLRYP